MSPSDPSPRSRRDLLRAAAAAGTERGTPLLYTVKLHEVIAAP